MSSKKPKKKSDETTVVETPVKRKRTATAAPPADFDPVADAPPLAPPPRVPADTLVGKAHAKAPKDPVEAVFALILGKPHSNEEIASELNLEQSEVNKAIAALLTTKRCVRRHTGKWEGF